MLNEAEHGITDLAMNNSRHHGDETLLVKFYKSPRQNQVKSAEEGRPIFEEVPFIQIMQPGNKDSIINRPATKMDKQRFAEHYRRFEAREDQEALEGTLLDEWAGITRSQCEELKYLNIRTVEQLAAVSDSNAQGVMGINFLKQKATKYLEESKDGAAAAKIAELEAKIRELSEKAFGDSSDEEKPTRKRRTKAEMEAAKAAE